MRYQVLTKEDDMLTAQRNSIIRNTKRTSQPRAITQQEFLALPRADQAVMIAQDVLAQLAAGALNPCRGSYIAPRGNGFATVDVDLKATPDRVTKIAQHCTVCAKGALFLSHIRFGDRVTVGQTMMKGVRATMHEERMSRRLTESFDQKTLDLIEYAFESGRACDEVLCRLEGDDCNDERQACCSWAYDYSDSATRLAGIMVNVIAHRGVFVPKDMVSPLEAMEAIKKAKLQRVLA